MDVSVEFSSPVRHLDADQQEVFDQILLSDGSFDDSDADPDFKPLDCSSDEETPIRVVVSNKKDVTSNLKVDLNEANNNNSLPDNVNSLPINTTTNGINSREPVEKKLCRKRKSEPSLWRKNITKNLRCQGREYKNSKGVIQRARRINKACAETCIYSCTKNFNEEDRLMVHNTFWSLTDDNKLNFYSKFTRRVQKERKRTSSVISRRQDTFLYFFEKDSSFIKVCKTFFLSTLDVSQNRIYYFHNTKTTEIGTSSPVAHGKHIKYKITEERLNIVREHIKSFPLIESHYCRASTERKYLETGLSIQKMFRLYLSTTNDPVKFNIYSKIFNNEFNLSFFVPKKDQCNRCVAHGFAADETTKQNQAYLSHKHNLELTKAERDLDRANKDEFTAVVCYDLQNVFALPRAPVSNFFYRRKFSVYNLTGHCSINKVTYCAIWNETLSGRTGNDLATSLIKILENVVSDNPKLKKIILWSDSCVPQNRNRVTTLAILKFLEAHPSLIEIQQKFSEAGHSEVQEIDAVHSTIERHLRNQDIYSPISLIKLLKSMEYAKVHLKIIQLKPKEFKNYNGASIGMNFPPFASVCNLIYQQSNLSVIKYRIEYGNSEIITCGLIKNTRQNIVKKNAFKLPTINSSQFNYKMPPEKKKDLRSMLMYMPEIDKQFYNIYLN